MQGLTHATIGAALALSVAPSDSVHQLIATGALGAVAGLLPDIDTPTSTAGRRARKLRLIVCIAGVALWWALRTDSRAVFALNTMVALVPSEVFGALAFVGACLLATFAPHRKATHSLAACLLFSAVWGSFAGIRWVAPFAASYMSHLVLDLCNKRPIALLWPIPWRMRLGIARTGGVLDHVLLGLGLIWICAQFLAKV